MYSNKINLPSFADWRKFKIENKTLNKYPKPVLLFMKHIAMWAPQVSIIIDVTSRTNTIGVCMLLLYICSIICDTFYESTLTMLTSGCGVIFGESELFKGYVAG